MKRIALALPVLLILAACSGGGGGGDATANEFCMAIGATNNYSCSGTVNSLQNCGQAFDGNLATFADLGLSGSTTFTGTWGAQQPAGRVAGVFFVTPGTGYTITVGTLMNGVPQETSSAQSPGSTHTCSPEVDCEFANHAAYIGLKTNLPYDGIQATISTPDDLHVQELCTR